MLRVVVRESMTEDLVERLIVDILQIVEAFMDGEWTSSSRRINSVQWRMLRGRRCWPELWRIAIAPQIPPPAKASQRSVC